VSQKAGADSRGSACSSALGAGRDCTGAGQAHSPRNPTAAGVSTGSPGERVRERNTESAACAAARSRQARAPAGPSSDDAGRAHRTPGRARSARATARNRANGGPAAPVQCCDRPEPATRGGEPEIHRQPAIDRSAAGQFGRSAELRPAGTSHACLRSSGRAAAGGTRRGAGRQSGEQSALER